MTDTTVPVILFQVPLEPIDRLGVEMVRRLIKQQQVGLFEERLAEGHAAAFAAGEGLGLGIAGWQTHGVHGHFEVAVEVPEIAGVDDVLQVVELVGEFIEVGIGLGHLIADVLIALQDGALFGDTLLDVAADVGGLIEARLLGNEADGDAIIGPCFADEFLIDARHDAQEGGLTGAVAADDADLGSGIEGEPNILEDFLAVVDLGELFDGIDITLGHEALAVWGTDYLEKCMIRRARRTG